MATNDARARRKISRSMRGNLNRAMWGRARRWSGHVRAYRLELGRRIRDMRLEQDIAIDELAAAAGLDRYCVRRVESGAVDAKLSTVIRIAWALGVGGSELVP